MTTNQPKWPWCTPAILSPFLRRTQSLEDMVPWLNLKGVGTGGFFEALQALLGPGAPGLVATTVTRLKTAWGGEFEAWNKRYLAGRRYVGI